MRGFIGAGRTLMVAAAVVGSLYVLGCGGNNNTSVGGGYIGVDTTGGNNTGGNNTGGNNDTLTYGGQKYRTVVIGGKRWMAENLNFPTSNGSMCYGSIADNCTEYGRLYSLATAQTACPAGWRLPSRREWGDLAIAAGGTGEYGTGGEAGYKLKSSDGWNQSGDGDDAFGFSALPGGIYENTFTSVGYSGFWWTATEDYSRGGYYYRRMDYNGGFVMENNAGGNLYLSVRCVKNT